MRKAVSLGVVLVLLLGGCQYAGDPAGRQLDGSRPLSVADYVGILQKAAQTKPSPDDPFYPETMELSAESTSFYSVRQCEVVYKDSRFVSFRADTEDYYGGNGNHHVVTVGTIERGSVVDGFSGFLTLCRAASGLHWSVACARGPFENWADPRICKVRFG